MVKPLTNKRGQGFKINKGTIKKKDREAHVLQCVSTPKWAYLPMLFTSASYLVLACEVNLAKSREGKIRVYSPQGVPVPPHSIL